jgi:predicted transcriptional regulator
MAARKFSELLDRMPPKQRERVEKKKRAILRDIVEEDLRGVRDLVAKTQADLAVALEVSQGNISDAEQRTDHLVSTVRRYVEALGGRLEVVAVFGDQSIRLRGV